MQYQALLALVPPLFVLLWTAYTKKIHPALALGIAIAALIASRSSLVCAFCIIKERFTDQLFDKDNLYVYTFLCMIGVLIVLLDRSGGARACAHYVTRHIRSARGAEGATLLVSALLIIDDFLSNLTVGYVMRPVTDSFFVPRAKLAYLVHSICVPLIILMPISSWVAMLTDQLSKSGIKPASYPGQHIIGDPFFVFLATIPFIFYSIFAIVSVVTVLVRRISYGPMREHEELALATGNLFGHKTAHKLPVQEHYQEPGHGTIHLIDCVAPIIVLVITFVLGILYFGGYYLFGGNASCLDAFKHNQQSPRALCYAALIALLTSIALGLVRKTLHTRNLGRYIGEGLSMMWSPILMLILASILGRIVQLDLHTGTYIAAALQYAIAPWFVPAIFFIIAAVIAFMIGTSWATIALLMPMAVPIVLAFSHVDGSVVVASLPLLLPVLGAIFSGAVCGDQLSPLSQTTCMVSASTGIDPMVHVKTQLPYALPAFIAALSAFTLSGIFVMQGVPLWANAVLSLAIGVILCLTLLVLATTLCRRRL